MDGDEFVDVLLGRAFAAVTSTTSQRYGGSSSKGNGHLISVREEAAGGANLDLTGLRQSGRRNE
jgi:hypothetical protein